MKTTLSIQTGFRIFAITGLLALSATYCSGRGNIDLSKATPVNAEPVSGKGPNGTVPEGSTQFNSLFAYQPGEIVSRKVGSVIDQTGTSLESDYDGDGLTNDQERASSQWVADYPRIEASVSTPVTLTIDLEKSRKRDNDTITSNITSDDFEDNRDKGTENIHRNEMGVKTTQVQDKYSGSSEISHSLNTSLSNGSEANAGYGSTGKDGAAIFSVSGGGKSASSSGNSWNKSNAFSETKTTFPDAPATNNLDRDGWSVKTNSAAKNARQYRADKSDKVNEQSIVRPNAGRVRAALYIKNFSVNMPVRLTNILCTLMFETPTGQLIPMQSFRLRNDDFSLFTLNLYGASEFGPYVIELAGLNTVEVENAIRLGYSPKIFIVDYDISHVPNSNYKAVLPGVIGDNVKIVEENAKGRTALVKVKGPGIREMYRVAAWEFDQATDPCAANASGNFRPGVSLENVLKRLNCARSNGQLDGVGVDFEAGDYIIDFSDLLPNLPTDQKVLVHGIKKLAGLETKVPCASLESKTGNDGITRSVCRMKKVTEFTADDNRDFGMWLVFANGKYYSHSDYTKTGSNFVVFDGQNANSEKVLRGISSIVWAGDNYDLIYVSLQELLAVQGRFGTNPLETNQQLNISTKWDSSKVGSLDTKYQPDKFSVFLGKAAKGDMVELSFKLNSNKQLQYNFGNNTAVNTAGYSAYKNFDYTLTALSNRFNIQDALKFEISMGLGGNATDWDDVTNTARLKPCNDNAAGNLDSSVDFVAQTFTVCFVVPGSDYDYSASGLPTLVNLYLRPKLLDEYRNVIWPEKLTEVKKFKGQINVDIAAGATKIQISNVVGAIAINDTLKIGTNSAEYRITAITPEVSNPKLINLDIERVSGGTGLAQAHKQFDLVKANSQQLQNPLVSVNITNGYFQAWNNYLGAQSGCFPASGCAFNTGFSGSTLGLIGLNYNESNLNWVGRNYFYKDRYDFNQLDASKYEGLFTNDIHNLNFITENGIPQRIDLQLMNGVSNPPEQPKADIFTGVIPGFTATRAAVWRNSALSVWAYTNGAFAGEAFTQTKLQARIQNLETGSLGNVIDLVSVTKGSNGERVTSNFALAQSGADIVLAWYEKVSGGANSWQIKAMKLTFSAQATSGLDISAPVILASSNTIFMHDGILPALAYAADGKAVFASYQSEGRVFIQAVRVMANGLFVESPVDLGHSGGGHSAITVDGTKAALAWIAADQTFDQNTNTTATTPNVIARTFTYAQNSGIQLGTERSIDNTSFGFDVKLALKGDRAIVVWTRTGAWRAMASLLDFSTNTTPILVDLPPVNQDPQSVGGGVAFFQDKGVVFWGSVDVSGSAPLALPLARIINMEGTTLGSDFQLDTERYVAGLLLRNEISLATRGDKLWATWTSTNLLDKVNIVARNFDSATNQWGNALKINQTDLGVSPAVAYNPDESAPVNAYFVWCRFAPPGPNLIKGIDSNYVTSDFRYGLNNFFTAPLIERNYTVTAKLR